GLVEALAAGAGAVQAGTRLARARQAVAVPDMIDVERTDDDDAGAGGAGHAVRPPSAAEPGQDAGDGRRHHGRDRAAEHRAQAEARQVLAPLRGQAADAADLDRD